jgi:transposase
MACYDISDKNTTPRDEHLKNAHHLEKKMEHGKKAAQSKHQVQLQKQAAQASKNGMAPNRFHQLQAALFVIQTCQSFAVVENRWENEKKHSRLTVRRQTTKTRIT